MFFMNPASDIVRSDGSSMPQGRPSLKMCLLGLVEPSRPPQLVVADIATDIGFPESPNIRRSDPKLGREG